MTEFTTWRSLVTGDGISAIPDSVLNHMDMVWWMDDGEGDALSDSIGSISGTLVGDWGTDIDSPTSKNTVTMFNGDPDRAYSDSRFWIGGETVSVGIWVRLDSSAQNYPIMTADDSQGQSDGRHWGVISRPDDDEFNLVHDASIFDADVGPHPYDQWIMLAYSADGNSASLRLYDDEQLIDSNSGSESRTTGSFYLNIIGDPNLGRFIESDVSVVMAADSEVSGEVWDQIHNDTKPQ